MARGIRIEYAGAFYHVMARGNRRERIFREDATEVGGVFRMAVGFEWRDSARSVNFTADKPAALVFR